MAKDNDHDADAKFLSLLSTYDDAASIAVYDFTEYEETEADAAWNAHQRDVETLLEYVKYQISRLLARMDGRMVGGIEGGGARGRLTRRARMGQRVEILVIRRLQRPPRFWRKSRTCTTHSSRTPGPSRHSPLVARKVEIKRRACSRSRRTPTYFESAPSASIFGEAVQ